MDPGDLESLSGAPAAALPPALVGHPGAGDLTWAELVHYPGVVERWIRFGPVAAELIVDRRTRFLGFAAGAVFAFVRWSAGDHGTAVSRLAIIRAVRRGAPLTTSAGVTPGGAVLLNVSGWARVQRALAAIDAVEALGLDAAAASPDHWAAIHQRLLAGQPLRAYSLERHAAWLARRTLQR